MSTATIYQALLGAGFSPSAAKTMVAISHAESGFNPTAVGDVGLETSTWGPSYGLFQVRTLKAQTGTGGTRDIEWLKQSIANQAKAAFQISNQGTNYRPWSVYLHGTYRQYLNDPITGAVDTGSLLDKAKAAIGDTTSAITNPLTGSISDTINSAMAPIKNGLLTGLFAAGGILVLGMGLYSITRPVADRAAQAVKPPKLLEELG